jgi:hydroxymethylglutaryl-CoA reductase
VNHRLLGVKSARELAEVMGAVGLGQNLAALRALATDGIQKGHMTLHARSVALAAGATADMFESVVERLIESGEVKIWKANEIVAELGRQKARRLPQSSVEPEGCEAGHGKVIVLGEHAVVYGRHAIAAPIPLAVQARVRDRDDGVHIVIPRWGIEHQLQRDPARRQSYEKPAALILEKLGLQDRSLQIEVFPNVPRAMGLGGSAALAVAIIRALDAHYALGLSAEEINSLAFEGEKLAHGQPSGIDNAVATYGRFLCFRSGEPPLIREIRPAQPLPLVIGMSGIESLTARMVARVRAARERHPRLYERIFDDIDTVALEGVEAIEGGDLARLGELMNVCQGLLNSLQVSSWEIEELVQIARDHGALGAKVTGGGGGGSMIALCPDGSGKVIKAMQAAGYRAMEVVLG